MRMSAFVWVAGLDTCLSTMRMLHSGLGDDKYRPCPLLVQYVDAGWLGVKSRRGAVFCIECVAVA